MAKARYLIIGQYAASNCCRPIKKCLQQGHRLLMCTYNIVRQLLIIINNRVLIGLIYCWHCCFLLHCPLCEIRPAVFVCHALECVRGVTFLPAGNSEITDYAGVNFYN